MDSLQGLPRGTILRGCLERERWLGTRQRIQRIYPKLSDNGAGGAVGGLISSRAGGPDDVSSQDKLFQITPARLRKHAEARLQLL